MRNIERLTRIPLFQCDWIDAVFIHLEVDPQSLQQFVPYELHLYRQQAYVSLVAFTIRGLRPTLGGRLAALLVSPIATHRFFNVRTYVRCGAHTGIFFIREWLDNRLSVLLGPPTFGLPYHYGRLTFSHPHPHGTLRGRVDAADGNAMYEAQDCSKPDSNGLTDFLLERYLAFTADDSRRLFFRVWHAPWDHHVLDVRLSEDSLLVNCFPWYRRARLATAHYSPGVTDVGVSFPGRTRLLGTANEESERELRPQISDAVVCRTGLRWGCA